MSFVLNNLMIEHLKQFKESQLKVINACKKRLIYHRLFLFFLLTSLILDIVNLYHSASPCEKTLPFLTGFMFCLFFVNLFILLTYKEELIQENLLLKHIEDDINRASHENMQRESMSQVAEI